MTLTPRRRWLVSIVITLALIFGATTLHAQGPFSAQIVAALRVFVQTAHTWTQRQTFGNITVNGTCTGCGGGGGTPGGATTNVQFNNAGAFGGVSTFTWVSPALGAPSLALGASPSTSTLGIVYKGTVTAANRFLHDFSPVGGNAENTFLGLGAGNFTMTFTTGEDASLNTGIGWHALAALTTGFANVFVGDEAGITCTSCNLNVGVGHQAGTNMSDGTGNTLIGVHAGHDIDTGDHNTGVGENALAHVAGSSSNTAVGASALANTTSFSNTAVGYTALQANVGGFSNVAIGDSALGSTVNVISNVAVGYNSMPGANGGSGGNTVIGTNAGGSMTTADNLVLVGNGADAGAAITNAIAIGAGAVVSASNMTVIGVATTTTFKTFGTNVTAGAALAVANVGANSCGTTAASVVGNDNGGEITVGATSGTQCRVTFAVAAPTRRFCAANDDTTTVAVRTTYVDSTHSDFIGTFTAADHVSFTCTTN